MWTHSWFLLRLSLVGPAWDSLRGRRPNGREPAWDSLRGRRPKGRKGARRTREVREDQTWEVPSPSRAHFDFPLFLRPATQARHGRNQLLAGSKHSLNEDKKNDIKNRQQAVLSAGDLNV